MMRSITSTFLLTITAVAWLSGSAWAVEEGFKIQVIDEETGRGVPLVELETVHNVRFVTDSNGLVAVKEPALLGQNVFFYVRSHGYEFAQDGFGYAGKAVDVTPGGSVTLPVKRVQIAQRLYRVTGADIYRDSVLLGQDVPIEHPLLNANVFGSDSVVNTVYQGEIRWFWGDTNRPGYPLGNFHVPGAVSQLPSSGGLDPDAGVDLSYFVGDDGFARPLAKMPGEGPTWIDGLVTLADQGGREQMFAAYVKIKPPLSVYARGLARWDDAAERFQGIAEFDLQAPALPGGHPVKHTQRDVEHVYFAKPYPLVRVRATTESLTQLDDYESFTCLVEGSRLEEPKLDRDASGTLRYAWKRDTPALDPQAQKKLIESGLMKQDEALLGLRDRETGEPVLAHGGSVYWNEYRQRWVMVFLEAFGSPSFLGEVWFAEADSLVGPWVYATKIMTHDRYDFYNPKQHPMFDRDGGRTIYLEGTYTNTFSGNPLKTPRYDYNQVMYKLDLEDSRLALPVAIYRTDQGQLGERSRAEPGQPEQVAFFALDRAVQGAVPVYATGSERQLTTTAPPDPQEPASVSFYALPADTKEPPATTTPLYEFIQPGTDQRVYATQNDSPAGYQQQAEPLCLVWQSPVRFTWEVETP